MPGEGNLKTLLQNMKPEMHDRRLRFLQHSGRQGNSSDAQAASSSGNRSCGSLSICVATDHAPFILLKRSFIMRPARIAEAAAAHPINLDRGGLDDVMADPGLIRGLKPYFIGRSTSQNRMMRLTSVVFSALWMKVSSNMKASPSRQTHSHAVDQDAALVRIGRDQAEVIAQRAGKGIAMRAELAAGRQHREHRAMHRRDRIQELDRLRAQRARRRKKVVVPFQVKPLPAALEERIKAPVVVLGGGADKALVEQPHRLLADRLPVLAQSLPVRESARPGSPACSEPPEPAYISTLCASTDLLCAQCANP